ncbi:enoyl-CoA-hydratase DpgB [Streptacidiphilus cavernicola]|uniref:Enoyl-CoA-hydratase DpgB n=1 Tax=Streptacidiphilus cavernicola TaxID=3342716 RepID=A0ABV6W5Z9_9ACTN
MANPIQLAAPKADFTLTIDGAQALTLDLVGRVTATCGTVEDADHGDTLLVRLGAHTEAAAQRHQPPANVHLVNKWERALRRLERLPVATVAVATGSCHGPSAETLLATDYRIAGTDLRLRLPETGQSTWPGMAIYRLAQQLGVARARQIALFGPELSAWQALELGLVDEVAEDPQTALRAALDNLAGARGRDVAVRRRLLMDAASTDFEEALGPHLAACDRALRRTQVA